MWGKLFKIDRIVSPEATQYTYQKYIPAHSLLRDTLYFKKSFPRVGYIGVSTVYRPAGNFIFLLWSINL